MVGCLLAVIYRQALHHAARPPDVGVPPSLWKPLFTDWADASSPPHLLTGASTVCYRGGQSDELSGSQLSTLPSSTTLFAAPDRNLTKSQNSKVEINKSSLPPLFPPFPKPDQVLPPQSFITTQHPLLILILHCNLPCPFFLSQLVLPLQPPVAPPQEPKTKKKYHYKTQQQQQQQTVFLSVCLFTTPKAAE